MGKEEIYKDVSFGEYPQNDGWAFFYKFYKNFVRPVPFLRTLLRSYFLPFNIEINNNRKIYRILFIDFLGRFIPTGGIVVRSITGAAMRPYTLAGTSLKSAREFFYRTCIFEFLHLPFFIALVIIVAHRLYTNQIEYAIENSIINIVFNVIPIMHHRNTRARIVNLLILDGDIKNQTTA